MELKIKQNLLGQYHALMMSFICLLCAPTISGMTISLPYNANEDSTVNAVRELTMDYNGGEESVALTTIGNAYKDFKVAKRSESWWSWCRVQNQSSFDKGILSIDKNMSVYDRSASFTSGVEWSWGDGQVTINILQTGVPVDVFLEGSQDVGIEGGNGTFKVETLPEASWRIESEWLSGDETDWITFSETSGSGSIVVSYAIAQSVFCRPRSAKIVVASKEYIFTQKGGPRIIFSSATVLEAA